MTQYSPAAQNYIDNMSQIDKNRLMPILELFRNCGEDTAVQYYHPNILYLSVKGKLALGLSPRKKYISFYVASFEAQEIFQRNANGLGTASQGVGCYRFNKLSDIKIDVLRDVFAEIYSSDHTGSGVLIPLT